MKITALLTSFILLSGLCYGQEQPDKLKLMEGTWMVDASTFQADQENQPPPPGMQVRCHMVSPGNGMYCEVLMPDGNGELQTISSELLAYNQSTDKIHLMLFNGNVVSYGTGIFEGNTFMYTDTDVNGKELYTGELHFEKDQLTQVVHIPGDDGGRMQVTFNKVE